MTSPYNFVPSNWPGPKPSPGPSQESPGTLRCCCRSPGKTAARCLHYRLLEAGFPVPGAPAWSTRSFAPHPLPGSPALCKLDCAATKVLGPPVLSTCPAVRHPQPRPGGRVREASSPPTYYAWMQTGRAYSVFPSGRSRLQAGPRCRLPAPRGCPARLRSRAARPGTVRAGLRKHCWSFCSSLRPALPEIAESCA